MMARVALQCAFAVCLVASVVGQPDSMSGMPPAPEEFEPCPEGPLPPVMHVKGPEGVLVPPETVMEFGFGLTYVDPMWHYPNEHYAHHDAHCEMGADGMRRRDLRSVKKSSEIRNRVKNLKESKTARRQSLAQAKPMNQREQMSSLEKVEKVAAAYTKAVELQKHRATGGDAAAAKEQLRHKMKTRAQAKGADSKRKAHTRFAQGDQAEPEHFPFIVSIQSPMDPERVCDGTLIAPNFVLTSALCLVSIDGSVADPEMEMRVPLEVSIGANSMEHRAPPMDDMDTRAGHGEPMMGCVEHMDVVDVHIHPFFLANYSMFDYGVAVVELSESSSHPPTPLYEGGDIMRDCNPDLLAVGWDMYGMLAESKSLMVLSEFQCQDLFPHNSDVTMCALERPTSDMMMMPPMMPPMSGSGSMSGMPPPGEMMPCVSSSGGPLLLRDEKSPTGYVQVGVGVFTMCMDGMQPEGYVAPDIWARVAGLTSWIYSIEGLGAPGHQSMIEVKLEFNLEPGMTIRLWDMAGADPISLSTPDEDKMIDMIVGEEMLPGQDHCGIENVRTYWLEEGAPFAVEFFIPPTMPPVSSFSLSSASGSGSGMPDMPPTMPGRRNGHVADSPAMSSPSMMPSMSGGGGMGGSGGGGMEMMPKPFYVVTYGRPACDDHHHDDCMMQECYVNTDEFTVRKAVELKKAGALFQGGLGMASMMTAAGPDMDGMMPRMPFDHFLMQRPSPAATWVCMRDWDIMGQKMCGVARHEIVCFALTADGELLYGGTNSMRHLVAMHEAREGWEDYSMMALHGEVYPGPITWGMGFYDNVNRCTLQAPFYPPMMPPSMSMSMPMSPSMPSVQ